MEGLVEVLMERDGMDEGEVMDLLAELRERVVCGEDPEELLREELGLEPDYIFDLLP